MALRRLKPLLVAAFSALVLLFSLTVAAQDHGPQHPLEQHQAGNPDSEAPKGGKEIDAAEVIMEHIMDNHEYHFADVAGHAVSLPLPIIVYKGGPNGGFDAFMSSRFEHGHASYKGYRMEHQHIVAEDGSKVYDLSLTRNAVQLIIASLLLIVIMINVAKKYKAGGTKAPSGFQNAVEPVIEFVRDEVGKPNLGRKYQKYMPYLLTVFFFILINNLLGLLPGSANVTGNISFTLVLAFISMLVILFSTNGHFWGHIFWPPGVPIFVKPILMIVEFLGVFIKPIALMIRLFANMVAGHIVIICFISLIFIFGAMSKVAGLSFSPISLAFTIFIYLIEILVAFIQAFIFTNLTAVFIGQAFETGHGEGHDKEGHHDPHPTTDGDPKEFAL